MKKLFFAAIFLCLVVFQSQAQLFVGGSFAFDTHSSEKENGGVSTVQPSSIHFGIFPKVGYFLNDDMAVGASIGYDISRTKKSAAYTGNFEEITVNNSFSIAPFFRYYAMDFGAVSLFGEAYMSFGFGASKTKVGSVTNTDNTTFNFGIGVLPGVSYKLNENIEIEANIGALSFERNSREAGNTTTVDSDFNVNLTSDLRLGFIYKF